MKKKFEQITIPAVSFEATCFGAENIEVKVKVDLEEFFAKINWSEVRDYFEEQIEDEILRERNEAYNEGYEEGKEFYSDYADWKAHKMNILNERF